MKFFKRFEIVIFAVGLLLGLLISTYADRLQKIVYDPANKIPEIIQPDSKPVHTDYDVLVFGGTPEALAAVISAHNRGLKSCLVYEKNTLGGVWANGKLNQIDNTYGEVSTSDTPPAYILLNRGVNEEFMKLLGIKRMSNGFYDGVFDADKVRAVFEKLLRDSGIDYFSYERFRSIRAGRKITAVKLISGLQTKQLSATYFIDASENGDLAAEAGCPYTLGRGQKIYGKGRKTIKLRRKDYGKDEAQMSSTLMFRVGGVSWKKLANVEYKGRTDRFVRFGNAGWGYSRSAAGFNNPRSMANGIMLRGLNLGRQSDGSVLVNGLLVFSVDGTSKQSVWDGVRRARQELPYIVEYLRENIPAFKNAYLIEAADSLYIRESRHFVGEYVLTLDDILRGTRHYDTITQTHQPVDIHPHTIRDAKRNLNKFGSLVDLHLQPKLYGIPFRSLLPLNIDNLVIAGKTISCTPKAAASTRMISIGISEAQATAMVIGLSKKKNRSLKDLAFDEGFWRTNVIEWASVR